jgi:protein-L-isoaspartate(D-aspartate) O-methyltransferase
MVGSAFSQSELSIVRRAFARQMLAIADVQDDRIERAFATVRREDFLGSEPWQFVRWPPVPALPQNDPAAIYQDVVIALQPGRGVNNGSPSLHARMLHDLAVEPGQHVAQIGAGAGYYTAMLAELVGSSGRVSAVELDAELAARARANLEPWRNVTVFEADGATAPAEMVDRIYVNFGVAAPAPSWIEHLEPDGRLLFPLSVPHPNARAKFPRHAAQGAVVLVDRKPNGFAATYGYPAYFVCAEGSLAGDEDSELALFAAFERGGIEFIKSLRWNEPVDPMRCWYWTARWSLSCDPLDDDGSARQA